MALKKVPISFKERERPIYDFLMEKGNLSTSIYIKQLLVKEMGKEEPQKCKEQKQSTSNRLIDF